MCGYFDQEIYKNTKFGTGSLREFVIQTNNSCQIHSKTQLKQLQGRRLDVGVGDGEGWARGWSEGKWGKKENIKMLKHCYFFAWRQWIPESNMCIPQEEEATKYKLLKTRYFLGGKHFWWALTLTIKIIVLVQEGLSTVMRLWLQKGATILRRML